MKMAFIHPFTIIPKAFYDSIQFITFDGCDIENGMMYVCIVYKSNELMSSTTNNQQRLRPRRRCIHRNYATLNRQTIAICVACFVDFIYVSFFSFCFIKKRFCVDVDPYGWRGKKWNKMKYLQLYDPKH